MQRLSVIPDITSLLAEDRKDFGEHLEYNRSIQEKLLRVVCSISDNTHKAFGHMRSLGVLTGIEDIKDAAYSIAMDGWERPNDATSAYWYSQALNEKIAKDTADQNLIAVIMLADMGDGDYLFREGSLVFAPYTFAMLAIHSDMAREATRAEVDETIDGVEAYAKRVVADATTDRNLTRLQKAGLIHARRLAA